MFDFIINENLNKDCLHFISKTHFFVSNFEISTSFSKV